MNPAGSQFPLTCGVSIRKFSTDKTQRTPSSGCFRPFRGLQFFRLPWRAVCSAALALLLFHGPQARAEDLAADVVSLRPLWIDGEWAKAHIKVLELADGNYYVAERPDDLRCATALFRDNGIGIPAEEQDKIRLRLYRGDKSRSQRGLGLGLSLVKAVVKAHGGQVTVSSQVNQGAQFIVRLPK